ncbi:MAG TPA: ribbon-helix-helix protein, CopG family [Chloroflexota bacterium]|nr:ribbon-helix-helix protein, CopG family [Chloroflexota bacterium]
MARDVTLRLPDETAARLEATAQREGRSVSETGARSIEEWLRLNEFPEIEFRTFNGERHACVKGFMQIWQLVMVAQGWDLDVETTAKYFPIPAHRIRNAFDYYRAYSEEIDQVIAENDSWTYERLKESLPQLERFSVELDEDGDIAVG